MKNGVKTTVIGSYPVDINRLELMDSYFSQKPISWNNYISNAVSDMVNAGIDIISDGQTRDPFIQIFTRKLKGCRIRDRTEVIEKIEYDGPITVDDQKFVRSIIPDNVKIVGILTGPFTLCKSCIDLFYNDEKELAFDLAKALREEAKNLEKYVDLLSIDEPFFSNEMPEYGIELIKIITEAISIPKRLHVCGNVSNIISTLVDMPVDILSHEFKASPELFDVFREYETSKGICLGSVRSDDVAVETVEEIKNHINRARDIFGDKIVQLAPDCGQRFLPKEVAFQKLKNLVKAGEEIYDE